MNHSRARVRLGLGLFGVVASLMLGAGVASAAEMPHTSGNGTHGTILGSSPLPSAHGLPVITGTHLGTTPCPTNCRPPKKPPKGGWPCTKTKSCASKHHYPVCPPTPPTTPPVTPPWHAKPGKPVVHHHKPVVHHPKPDARVRVVPAVHVTSTAASATPVLAYTGTSPGTPLYAGLGLLLPIAGVGLKIAGRKKTV